MKIRQVKKTLPDTNTSDKLAVAEAKRDLRLFKDPYKEDMTGQTLQKRHKKSIENQTSYSDSNRADQWILRPPGAQAGLESTPVG